MSRLLRHLPFRPPERTGRALIPRPPAGLPTTPRRLILLCASTDYAGSLLQAEVLPFLRTLGAVPVGHAITRWRAPDGTEIELICIRGDPIAWSQQLRTGGPAFVVPLYRQEPTTTENRYPPFGPASLTLQREEMLRAQADRVLATYEHSGLLHVLREHTPQALRQVLALPPGATEAP